MKDTVTISETKSRIAAIVRCPRKVVSCGVSAKKKKTASELTFVQILVPQVSHLYDPSSRCFDTQRVERTCCDCGPPTTSTTPKNLYILKVIHFCSVHNALRCKLLQLPTLCSPPLASDVLVYCLLAGQVTIDVQVWVSLDQECALMCLRLHGKKKKLAENLSETPDAHVVFAARHHPAVSL